MIKSGVVIFPGSNCSQDAFYALSVLGLNPEYIWHKETSIREDISLIVLPGGFSYGDYIRSGVVARHSPIIHALHDFIAQGKFVIGICNGFHILTEMGILKGALVRNDRDKFICRYEDIEIFNSESNFTKDYKHAELTIPIAHGDGRFFCNDEDLDYLEKNNLILFRYKNNPNGSVSNIAGIMNKEGNVLGMMPHPERVIDSKLSHIIDGQGVFLSIKQQLA